ncbi:MAG: hypothetical protein GY696_21410 [Gammaproteobacteria bacterium]|nr:hypothetical protein [Gammaproteobacteria bacterium]
MFFFIFVIDINDSEDGLPTIAIVGIVAGILLAILFLIVLGFLYCKMRMKQSSASTYETANE